MNIVGRLMAEIQLRVRAPLAVQLAQREDGRKVEERRKRMVAVGVLTTSILVLISCTSPDSSTGPSETSINSKSGPVTILLTGVATTGGDGALLEGISEIVDGALAVRSGSQIYIPIFNSREDSALDEFAETGRITGWLISEFGEPISFGGGGLETFMEMSPPVGADKFWMVSPLG